MNLSSVILLMSADFPTLASPTTTTEHSIRDASLNDDVVAEFMIAIFSEIANREAN